MRYIQYDSIKSLLIGLILVSSILTTSQTILPVQAQAPPECTPPQVLDPTTNQCVIPVITCPPDQVLDPAGQCVTPPPPECTPPQVHDPAGQCVTPPPPECTPPEVLDPTTNQCVILVITCPPDQVLDPTGQCVTPPPPECTPPQVLDPTGQCVTLPPPECTPPEVLDPATNTCVTPPQEICGNNIDDNNNELIDENCPTLIVIKHVINDNGGTAVASDFKISTGGTNASPADGFDGAESPGVIVTLDAGSYTVSETGPPGYSSSTEGDCSGTINIGETKTCTITNDDNGPTLTLDKILVNDNGGTAAESDWTLTAAGPTNLSGPGAADSTDVVSDATFKAGTYTLSESTGPAGYAAGAWTCVGGIQDGNQITLELRQSATCTITNDDVQPKLVVIKHVINDNGGPAVASDFTMSVTGNSPSPASFSGAESPGTSVAINAGAYNVGESGPSGYSASFSADCTGAIAVGETKTCTVTNDDISQKGRMTGGGSVFTENGVRVTHGFELQCMATKTPNNLEVNWDKNKFHLDKLDSAFCFDNPNITSGKPVAPFNTYSGSGTGTLNGKAGAKAVWTFTDAGEPGKNDFVSLQVFDASNKLVLSVSGTLNVGNQQAHS